MKLDPHKTASALAGGYITVIACWCARYFWHVDVPDTVATAVAALATLVFSHVPFFSSNPPQAAEPPKVS